MVSILLTVLKIIGITVLIILGLILCILLLALFVPVRYRGRGEYQDGISVKLRVSWLLHLVSIKGIYQNGQALQVVLKLLGITVYDNLRADRTKTKHKKEKLTKNKTEGAGEIQAASSEENNADGTVSEKDRTVESGTETIPKEVLWEKEHEEEFCEEVRRKTEMAAGEGFSGKTAVRKVKKLGIVQKIKNIFTKFVKFFKNIKFTFYKVCDTIVRIKGNINYYLKVLQMDSTKRALTVCQSQLVYVLRKISPQKYRINLHLGFEDPAVMGEVLAVWGMFYPLHLGNIDLQPEFEQSVMEGDFSFQGHVSVAVFVRAACILFFDRDFKCLLKHLKRSET